MILKSTVPIGHKLNSKEKKKNNNSLVSMKTVLFVLEIFLLSPQGNAWPLISTYYTLLSLILTEMLHRLFGRKLFIFTHRHVLLTVCLPQHIVWTLRKTFPRGSIVFGSRNTKRYWHSRLLRHRHLLIKATTGQEN